MKAKQALAAAGAVIGYVDLITTRASGASLDAQQLLLADSDRARRELLKDLLEAGSPQTAAGMAVAREVGLEPDARCVLVAAVATNSPRTPARCPAPPSTLAGALRGRYGPLAVARHGEIVLVQAQAGAGGRRCGRR